MRIVGNSLGTHWTSLGTLQIEWTMYEDSGELMGTYREHFGENNTCETNTL